MAVFRVQKTQNYTIMSNHHLRNKALSLKAKGLLSLMLSLPEDWDYTTRGLASICKEGVDSVCATVRELEAAGYIIRRRIRDKNGQMRGMEYTVLEQPQPPEQGPEEAAPKCAQPKQAEPKREKPVQENPAQLNTKEIKKEESNMYFFFLRPRRFGKSLTISMLENYYDINKKDKFDETRAISTGS